MKNELLLIAGGSTLIYIVIVMLIAVLPAIELSRAPAGPGVKPLTSLQAQGRAVYAANGCSYCHTQQIRPLAEDRVFGRPSAPGDFAYQTPELLGSERTGPDLTNVGNSKPSQVWQYIHLYAPRALVPESIMPNFKFLFRDVATVPAGATAVPVPDAFAPEHGVVIPTQKAQALVAYLLALKQAAIPGYPSSAGAAESSGASPPVTAPASESTSGTYRFDSANGKALFTANCSPCHQSSGKGVSGAFPPLEGNVAVNDTDPSSHILTVLRGASGVVIGGMKYASPMPPFAGQLDDTQIADIINYERTSWGNHAKQVTPRTVAAVRANSQ